ncbi:MAG: hypothetical protein AVDCRST_MAG59-3810, partial [uncultured Thermomicrobiales bacterium]
GRADASQDHSARSDQGRGGGRRGDRRGLPAGHGRGGARHFGDRWPAGGPRPGRHPDRRLHGVGHLRRGGAGDRPRVRGRPRGGGRGRRLPLPEPPRQRRHRPRDRHRRLRRDRRRLPVGRRVRALPRAAGRPGRPRRDRRRGVHPQPVAALRSVGWQADGDPQRERRDGHHLPDRPLRGRRGGAAGELAAVQRQRRQADQGRGLRGILGRPRRATPGLLDQPLLGAGQAPLRRKLATPLQRPRGRPGDRAAARGAGLHAGGDARLGDPRAQERGAQRRGGAGRAVAQLHPRRRPRRGEVEDRRQVVADALPGAVRAERLEPGDPPDQRQAGSGLGVDQDVHLARECPPLRRRVRHRLAAIGDLERPRAGREVPRVPGDPDCHPGREADLADSAVPGRLGRPPEGAGADRLPGSRPPADARHDRRRVEPAARQQPADGPLRRI